MAKAELVKAAQKDYPEAGIKKGESYWKWSFLRGGKFKSKTKPTRSQLTRSDFLGQLYALEDGLDDRFSGMDDADELAGAVDELVGEIESLRDETQEKLDNMPDPLKDGDTGQLLQERIDGLESWISDLQAVDTSIESDQTDEEKADRIEDIICEITGASAGL